MKRSELRQIVRESWHRWRGHPDFAKIVLGEIRAALDDELGVAVTSIGYDAFADSFYVTLNFATEVKVTYEAGD